MMKLADYLLQNPLYSYGQEVQRQGSQTTPVLSWQEGLARALQGGLGGLAQGYALRQARGEQTADQQALQEGAALYKTDPEAAMRKFASRPNLAADVSIPLFASDIQYQKQLDLLKAQQQIQKDTGTAILGSLGGLTGGGAAAGGPVNPNNIGNVRPEGGGPNSGFQQPPTFDDGVALSIKTAQAYPAAFNGGKPMTLAQIGQHWAPPGDGKNDPAAWAKNVSIYSGLPADQPIDLNNPATAAAYARGVHGAEHGASAVLPAHLYAPGVQKAFGGGQAAPGPQAQAAPVPGPIPNAQPGAVPTPIPNAQPGQVAPMPAGGPQVPPQQAGNVPAPEAGNVPAPVPPGPPPPVPQAPQAQPNALPPGFTLYKGMPVHAGTFQMGAALLGQGKIDEGTKAIQKALELGATATTNPTLAEVRGPNGETIRVPTWQANGMPAAPAPASPGTPAGDTAILTRGVHDETVRSSPEYAAAYNRESAPKQSQSGQIMIPDMSAYPKPGGGTSAPGYQIKDTPASQLEMTTKLAKDFNAIPEVQKYKAIAPMAQVAQDAMTRPGKAADMNLLQAYARIISPGSERFPPPEMLKQLANVGSLPEEIKKTIAGVVSGGGMSQDERQRIMDEIQSRVSAYKGTHDTAAKIYSDWAKELGLNPDRILQSPVIPEGPQAAPQTGERRPDAKLIDLSR